MTLLTAREQQVLELLAEGMSNRAIGDVLWLSENTIKTHCQRLSAKLHAHGRAHVVARGFQLGFLTLGDAA